MARMPNVADVLVVGLGAVGSATLYQSVKLGARAIGIDRFDPPHDQGSSHGDTRITREAIGEGREFVPLVLRSNQIWQELETTTGRNLLTRNGGLVLASPSMPGNHHGSTSFIKDTIAAAIEFSIAHEILSTDELCHRYPQFCLRGDEIGYFEPGAGFLRPEACIDTQLTLGKHLGAKVITSETVTDCKPRPDGTVEVITSANTYSAAKVIVTAGPWMQKLLGEGYAAYLKIYRQVMYWFAVESHPEQYTPERFPVFIWIAGNRPRDMLYGFPSVDGPHGGIKIAAEQYDTTVDPNAVPRAVTEAEISAMYTAYIAPRFPSVSGKCLRTATCLYTVTPDAKFIVDRFRNYENIVFASACSGHGFKHSAALGEALALQALGRASSIDLSGFRARRLSPEALEKTSMHPKIVQLDGFEVIGIAVRTNNAKEAGPDGAIPKLWQRVMQERVLDRVPDKTSPDLYAVYTDYASDANGDYTLGLGAKVQPGTNPSEGMIAKVVPAGQYAVFTSERGPVAKVVVETWLRIWSHYQIPANGQRAYQADFELYDERAADPNNAQVEIYIGMKWRPAA
jgi:sarcosine oxidase